jgi:hypothetical protein
MEKKAPVKKVLLRKEDVFYVYDKRINKCAKKGCCGTVKYGLNLQVQMPNGDVINTYECNNCHMKYTAYANYVRLKDSRSFFIYNYREVKLRDRKRWEDAKKQERIEKQKFQNKRPKLYGDKKYHNNKVTVIGGYKKRYISEYNQDKRIAATE